MGRLSKTRGTGYEYRIRDYFRNEKQQDSKPIGWEAERNSLSREEKSFGEVTAKHDVKAWKDVEAGRIFLQIEAKKTSKDIHTLQKEWIDKIDFTNDELLVIALNRTPHYAIITVDYYKELAKANPKTASVDLATVDLIQKRGKKSIRVRKEELDGLTWEQPRKLVWSGLEQELIVVPLYDFVALREQLPPNASKPVESLEPDIAIVEADVPKEIMITCPRTGYPIRIIPLRK